MVEIFSAKIDKHIANRQAGEFISEVALLMDIPRSASIRNAPIYGSIPNV